MMTDDGKITLDERVLARLAELNLPPKAYERVREWMVTEEICRYLKGTMEPFPCDNPHCHHTTSSLTAALLDQGWRAVRPKANRPVALIFCPQCAKWADEVIEHPAQSETVEITEVERAEAPAPAERVSLTELPFTEAERKRYDRAYMKFCQGELKLYQATETERAALLRVRIDSAVSSAISLGSRGEADIDKCRAEFLGYCCSVFDEHWRSYQEQAEEFYQQQLYEQEAQKEAERLSALFPKMSEVPEPWPYASADVV